MVPSLDPDRTLRPRDMIPVEVTERVCPFNVRAAVILLVVYDATSGTSAGKMERAKSAPEVRTTREDGKNRRDVTVLTWALLMAEGMAFGNAAGRMYTEPSW